MEIPCASVQGDGDILMRLTNMNDMMEPQPSPSRMNFLGSPVSPNKLGDPLTLMKIKNDWR